MKAHFAHAVFFLVVLLTLPSVGFARTWYVDDNNCPGPGSGTKQDPFCKIQDGINAASDGDMVLVMPGLYMENIDFLGKAITVKSEQGPEVTIIDGNHVGSVVKFVSDEGQDSVLDGFWLTNGKGTVVFEPVKTVWGGGVFVENSSPLIVNNLISDNFVVESHATACGGGIGVLNSTAVVIRNNKIFNNTAYGHVDTLHSTYGGGIRIKNSGPSIRVENNLICNNVADGIYETGGGLSIDGPVGSQVLLLNDTICNNSAEINEGGGVWVHGQGTSVTIINCIVWENTSSNGYEICLAGNSIVDVSCSDVCGGNVAPYVYVYPGSTLNWGSGMLNVNPIFVTGPGLFGDHYLSQTAAGQDSDSPCVDAGCDLASNTWLDSLTTMDILTTRTDHVPDSGTTDMGYHYLSEIGARFGNVNLGDDNPLLRRLAILLVNGSPGDEKRIYITTFGTRVIMTMDAPPNPHSTYPGQFTLYLITYEPGIPDMAVQPYSIGTSCMPMPLSNGNPKPPPFTLVNNIGHNSVLGEPIRTVPPAPCTIFDVPRVPRGTYTMQGYIFDGGSAGNGVSLTNAIVLKVQ